MGGDRATRVGRRWNANRATPHGTARMEIGRMPVGADGEDATAALSA